MIWSNFKLETESFKGDTIINSENLIPFIFEITNLKGPLFYQFINSNSTKPTNKDNEFNYELLDSFYQCLLHEANWKSRT